MKTFNSWVLASIVLLLLACGQTETVSTEYSAEIYVNQHGYVLGADNKVLINDYEGVYKVLSVPKGKVIVEGNTTELKEWSDAGSSFSLADISALKTAGEYQLLLDNGNASEPFKVGTANQYTDVSKAAYRTFYLNRAGMNITKEFGGIYARKAGHPDTAVVVHKSVTNSSLKPGSVISSPEGWYDAGDYGKYIVNSAITVHTMLMAYEQYPEYHKNLHLNIPESESNIPDVIEELLYNVRWMLSMQDADGGVYHKLTTENFIGFIMPEETTETRYVFMKSTSASLTFAASMASFARVTKNIEGLEGVSVLCEEAAVKAWNWSLENPKVDFVQPQGVSTGQYESRDLSDEWQWAAVELYIITQEADYLADVDLKVAERPGSTHSWGDVHTLALISTVLNEDKFTQDFYLNAKTVLLEQMEEVYTIYTESAASMSLDFFRWGSNSDIANQAMMASVAYKITGDERYLNMATNNVDYLMGRNPMGYCFVTGFGSKSPINLHHRPSGADGIDAPHPGFLAGGPNVDVMSDCADSLRTDKYPAISFEDQECSFSTNECAINWTAALIYASAIMANLE